MKVQTQKMNLKMMNRLHRPVLIPVLIMKILKRKYLVIKMLYNYYFFIYIISLHNINLGSMSWVQRQIMGGINPRRLLHQVFGASVPSQLEDITLWRVCNFYLIFFI